MLVSLVFTIMLMTRLFVTPHVYASSSLTVDLGYFDVFVYFLQ